MREAQGAGDAVRKRLRSQIQEPCGYESSLFQTVAIYNMSVWIIIKLTLN